MTAWKAIFLAAVLACTAVGRADAAEMEKLKVAISFAGLWTSSQPIFCKDRGKFSEVGLDVDVVATRGGSENVQAVITRAVDIGYGAGLSAVLAAQMQGTDIKIIGSGFISSRTNPQYNAEEFAKTLSEFQIGYEHIAALGGLRGRKQTVPTSVNAFWENKSFHNYADYARSDEFRSGLARLRELGHATLCVMMCAEAVWWRCHRRIIADYLIAAGESVFHILGVDHVAPARLAAGAVLESAGTLSYPGHSVSTAKDLH